MPLTAPGPRTLAALVAVAAHAAALAPIRAVAQGTQGAPDEQKLRCAKAYELGQRARKAGQLAAALDQLRVCAAASCPAFVRDDCARWSDEVSASVPTIVLSARTARGGDLLDVAVSIDGAPLVDRLDGKARAVDPGTHLLHFEHEGSAPIEQRIVVREGEKLRAVAVVFGPAAPSDGPDAPPDAKPAPTSERSRVPAATWILGAVGVASLAGFGYFAARGLGQKHDLDGCKPGCAPGDVDAAKRSFLFGDVLLGAGVAALAGAAIVWASSSTTAVGPRATLGVGPTAGGLGASLQGAF